MDDKPLGKLSRGIEAKMRHAYWLSRRRVFYPEQFDGSTDAVLTVFKRMAEEGSVELLVDALCQEGHRVWCGHPEDLRSVALDYCNQCDDQEGVELHTQLRAEITAEWADELRREVQDQKKVNSCRT